MNNKEINDAAMNYKFGMRPTKSGPEEAFIAGIKWALSNYSIIRFLAESLREATVELKKYEANNMDKFGGHTKEKIERAEKVLKVYRESIEEEFNENRKIGKRTKGY
jgi:hypothetical protein